MALIHLNFHSDILGMAMQADVILPQKNTSLIGLKTTESETYPTLWLLHGLSDDNTIWQRRTSIERYASERGIAVVMVNGHKSWYCDMKYGERYFTYLTEELPKICRHFFRGMSARREDNVVAGLSMGGYGALKCALTYPDRYAAAASLSGAVDIAAYVEGKKEQENPYWYAILGDFDKVRGSENDLFALAERCAASPQKPRLSLWCGTEDHLIHANRRLKAHLDALSLAPCYAESEGDHSWTWWDLHIRDALAFFFDPSAENS
ncbi:MAG: esterase family protein [Clostridia bacterium]|nr:esterase family protein [Clostridia bacterium]